MSPSTEKRRSPDLADAVRLQKLLAEAGYGSRRACEELIADGRVAVDGQAVTALGTRVDADSQRITVDGERVRPERKVYYLVNKPRGVLCTNTDPEGRPRVIDLVPRVPQRVYTVGRLDQHSEGLILVTNDGALAQRLTHPRHGAEKVYVAQVHGHPSPEAIRQVARGVWSSAGKLSAHRIRRRRILKTTTELELVLREGKNRHVRRMLAKVGHKVLRLRRIAIAGLRGKGLKPGEARPLTREEVSALKSQHHPKRQA